MLLLSLCIQHFFISYKSSATLSLTFLHLRKQVSIRLEHTYLYAIDIVNLLYEEILHMLQLSIIYLDL